MKLVITVDIDVAESGLDEEQVRDNIVDFKGFINKRSGRTGDRIIS